MKILLSYSHRDIKAALNIKRALEDRAFSVWMDEHEISFGDVIAGRLLTAIASCDYVLVIITPNSVRSSWVAWEIDCCILDEKARNQKKLLPVLVGGDEIPLKIADRRYADFRTHEQMKANFEKLTRELIRARPAFVPESYQSIHPLDVHRSETTELIQAPIVGTVYLKRNPDEAPLISIGDRVWPNKVLLILEAMKLFHEIESPLAGVVADIFVKDWQSVEYDEPLVAIEIDKGKPEHV